MNNFMEEIVARRKRRVKRLGYGMGAAIPKRRSVPLIPFGQSPFLICEVKKASPSRGVIAPDEDTMVRAERYRDMGIKTLSVLTEEEYFLGSLSDLMRIKTSYPELCVLRKDFIMDEEDISVSFRAGADAVLLIASMHDEAQLHRLHRIAHRYGMAVLLEVHDEEDLRKAERIRPRFTGFNSRNLRTFDVDLAQPVRLASSVTWDTISVFESGIRSEEEALFALSSGFSGLLVGEAAMRNIAIIPKITEMFHRSASDFWRRLYRRGIGRKPLVKICGITTQEDAQFAAEMGADILGFVFASSPRKARASLVKKLKGLDVLKVGVVVNKRGDLELAFEVQEVLTDGYLDAVQFHGEERPADCFKIAYPYYKALRLKDPKDIDSIARYRCPHVLIDTFVHGVRGGTGERIAEELVSKVKARFPLWIAGGIGPDNVRRIVKTYKPELIDSSSMLEESPGIKSRSKIKRLFEEIRSADDL
jgi:indole-3-glycerol phosphate synthase/phosphoribosylanthranilate isomerase